MGGPITRKQYIKDLEERLANTTDERARREIAWEIEGLKLKLLPPPIMVCSVPEAWTRNHPITGRKGKKKEE